jgi:hypothetical protein
MLAWIGRHGIVTPEQLARRFFARAEGDVGMRVAYRRFAKLQSLGLLRRDATPHCRSPHVIRLTQAGAKPGRGRTPDGELTLASGKLVAVELDLTPKRTKDFERILRSYKQERFDLVWWYVLPGTLPRLRRVVADNRADDYVEVRPWDG